MKKKYTISQYQTKCNLCEKPITVTVYWNNGQGRSDGICEDCRKIVVANKHEHLLYNKPQKMSPDDKLYFEQIGVKVGME